jgi:hypothetical protein
LMALHPRLRSETWGTRICGEAKVEAVVVVE